MELPRGSGRAGRDNDCRGGRTRGRAPRRKTPRRAQGDESRGGAGSGRGQVSRRHDRCRPITEATHGGTATSSPAAGPGQEKSAWRNENPAALLGEVARRGRNTIPPCPAASSASFAKTDVWPAAGLPPSSQVAGASQAQNGWRDEQAHGRQPVGLLVRRNRGRSGRRRLLPPAPGVAELADGAEAKQRQRGRLGGFRHQQLGRGVPSGGISGAERGRSVLRGGVSPRWGRGTLGDAFSGQSLQPVLRAGIFTH